MRKLVVAIVMLAAFGLTAPPAQASPILPIGPAVGWQAAELGFKSSADGLVYDNPYGTWPPPTADLSAFSYTTGLGSISFTFTGSGDHYVAGFFDYQYVEVGVSNGIDDEEAYWGSVPAGWTGKSNDPWNFVDPSNPPPIYDQFTAFDATHPFDNWAWSTPGHDVAVAYGVAFTLAGGETRTVIFGVTDVRPASYFLRQVDEASGSVLYFTTEDVGGQPTIPEPSTLVLLALGLAVAGRKLCRRPL